MANAIKIPTGNGGGSGTVLIPKPTVSIGTYTYNGTEQSPTITGFDPSTMYISGTSASTNAGSFTFTIGLINNNTHVWYDQTTGLVSNQPLEFNWSIAKKMPTVTFSVSSMEITCDNEHQNVGISFGYEGDGECYRENDTLWSGDPTICTVDWWNAYSDPYKGRFVIYSTGKSGSCNVILKIKEGTNWTEAECTFVVTADFVHVYGVEWDGSSTTAWTRTDDAANFSDPVPYYSGMSGSPSSPFDSCYPWKDIKRVTRTNGEMVEIPKFWYKFYKNGSKMILKIANQALNGYSVSPAHMDRGFGEKDKIYISRYHCATSTYKSTSGVKPQASKTRAEFRSAIHNLGSTTYQWDYACLVTIWMLYLVEFADWNSQAKIGYGCGDNSAVGNMGYTDSMPYHTGTTQTSRTTYGLGTQYRYIEGLWDNVCDWIDGVSFSGTDVYAILNPANYTDSTFSTAVKVNTRPSSNNYISAYTFSSVTNFEWFLYPSVVSGSSSTYVCDSCFYYSTSGVLGGGGNYSHNEGSGLFFHGGCYSSSYSDGYRGSRFWEYDSAA